MGALAFLRRPSDASAQIEYVRGILIAIRECVAKEKARRGAHDAAVTRLTDEALGYMADGRHVQALKKLLELRALM